VNGSNNNMMNAGDREPMVSLGTSVVLAAQLLAMVDATTPAPGCHRQNVVATRDF
jgi:hypothetical protein